MRINRPLLFCAGAVLLSASLSTICAAQSANPTSRVVYNHVRPDMINEWLDPQKNEVVPALKKAGVKTALYIVRVLSAHPANTIS